ncbi:MAG: Holliday junction branch migration protein RuvA [Kordiimonadaceae bacterium]|nr:Holliday junction branch migration protein RuvA [Kordiimonadaceae bacterium]MBO6569273.1 Holliday junction branch migration protein RuvA [Kordiimonadaceae bacterium]MBO6964749.1 Holliday junction branch migration protein RuvA [Kordiimonadaceae bacterium]
MIAKLKGIVDSSGEDWVIMDVSGVGYLVSGSSRTLAALPRAGDAAMLHIETIVREDAISLFGFADIQERDLFRLLTSVQGVGAKVALAILSSQSPTELQNAIAAQDKTAVSRAKGVGPKVATRIVTELKDKVTGLVFQPKGVQAPAAGAPAAPVDANDSVIADAVSALANLGYKPVDAHGAVARVLADLGEDADVASIVPAALKELSSL